MSELGTGSLPFWLDALAAVLLAAAMLCAIVTAVDVAHRPQTMAVMNVVWPVTMLFGSLLWLWFYLRHGRAGRRGRAAGSGAPAGTTWVSTATGTSHCGAGCALGDLVAEFAVAALPALAVAVGWQRAYQQQIFAAWIWDFAVAFVLGIGFQYWAVAPMRPQSRLRSLRDAVKADAASIIAWQIGMYGAMAFLQFLVFPAWLGGTVSVFTPVFWLAMQLAMVVGFCCSYPVNALLIRAGIKEAM